jgi:hypothetical protein
MQCNSDWACRLKTGSRSLLCFLPAFIALTFALGSTAALADACGEETAALKSIARGVEVTIRAPKAARQMPRRGFPGAQRSPPR